MDTNTTETVVVAELPLKHQLGQTIVGGIAAFAANRVAEKGYVKALQFVRARKGS